MPAKSLAYNFMSVVTIKNEDFVLIHREGVDYKTPFTSVLASLPDNSVEIDGVLTYKGVVDAATAQPEKKEGEIWLLLLADGATANSWVPDGAKNGDYLTYASDTEGNSDWRLVGNAAGVDFEIYATKDEVQGAYNDLLARIDEKPDADDLNNLEERVKQNETNIAGTAGTLTYLQGEITDLQGDIRGLNVDLLKHDKQFELIGQSFEQDHAAIDSNSEEIKELKAGKFNFADLALLPA